MDVDVRRKQQGVDYNHSVDPEYQRLRSAANDAMNSRKRLAEESQRAYKSGDKAKAHELSEKAKKKLAEADDLNMQAAEYVFVQNNADSSSNEIDLHGLYVKEAMWILKKRMVHAAEHGETELRVITGKGVHSQNHVSKVKQGTIDLFEENGLKYHIPSKNEGVVVVQIDNSKIPQTWKDDRISTVEPAHTKPQTQNYYNANAGPQYNQPDHQQSQHHHQQSHHHQQQQQHGQHNNNATNAASIVLGLVRQVCICLTSE